MTPIINPWVFYFIGVADSIVRVVTVLAVISVVVFAVAALFSLIMLGEYEVDDDGFKIVSSITKKAAVLAAIFFTLSAFVPHENTITKMLIARNVTYERVEAAADTVETVYNDIMSLFEEAE